MIPPAPPAALRSRPPFFPRAEARERRERRGAALIRKAFALMHMRVYMRVRTCASERVMRAYEYAHDAALPCAPN